MVAWIKKGPVDRCGRRQGCISRAWGGWVRGRAARVGGAEIRKILDCQLCSLYDDDDDVDVDGDEVDALEHVIMPTKLLHSGNKF